MAFHCKKSNQGTIEKVCPLTWINVSKRPPSQIILAPSANSQSITGEKKNRGNWHGKRRTIEVAKPHEDHHPCRIRRAGGRRIARRIGGCSAIRYGTANVRSKRALGLRVLSYHMNPAGGGVLNAIGKQYETNGHKFKK